MNSIGTIERDDVPPVAIFGFNRPEQLIQVFARVREAMPRKLFLILDAPRRECQGDVEKCSAVRNIFASVDWPCEVLRNYAETNMGCDRRVASGLSWVFENVEEAIILEDDCVPHPTFFRFCKELLEKYRADSRVGMIAGHIGCPGQNEEMHGESYYFSRTGITWGWATWRRAWKTFDFTMSHWPTILQRGLLDNMYPRKIAKTITQTYQRYWMSEIPWDCAWSFSMCKENMLTIHPGTNLITNIGFTDDATHCRQKTSIFANVAVQAMDFPMIHPLTMIPNTKSEHRRMQLFARPNLYIRCIRWFLRRIVVI